MFVHIHCYIQCGGSGMFIPDPGTRILIFTHPGSRISDPGSKNSNKRERWKKICYHTFFCSHKFHKIEYRYYVSFKMLKKKFGPIFNELLKFLPKKFSIFSQIYGFGIRDPRSGIRKKPIPDPGSRGQKGTGSRIRIRNTVIHSWQVGKTSILYILRLLLWNFL